MNTLDNWLQQATRGLADDSATQVHTEIREHYESSELLAINRGDTAEEAHRSALTALGDAHDANCQYRKVLLTSAEAKMLREGNWEAHAVCSRIWFKRLLLLAPFTVLSAAVMAFMNGSTSTAWTLLGGAITAGFLFATPFLPVYTPSRSRVFRYAKWIILPGMLALIFGPDTLKWSWLLISSLWPMIWIEMTRIAIRRKLPVAKWPRHLYL